MIKIKPVNKQKNKEKQTLHGDTFLKDFLSYIFLMIISETFLIILIY